MKVFVTGATGFIGTAIVQELIGAGHQVLGLARSEQAAQSLIAAGAEAHRGSLEDHDSLRRGVELADGVIHAGFIHDFTRFAENCEIDRQAILAMGEALKGSQRPLIVTSGIGLLPPGQFVHEADMADPSNPMPRIATEVAATSLIEQGLNVSLLRLPPSVHGVGDHGFVPMLIGIAREKGVSAFIGSGDNRWPAVHRLDAARLYRLALEKAQPGARYHGVAEQGVAFREIADVIGRRLNLPVSSLSHDEAAAHFTWFTHFAGLDCPASSEQTRTWLDWNPTQPGLLADIDQESYFA